MKKESKTNTKSKLGQMLLKSMEEAVAFESGTKKDLKTDFVKLPPSPKVIKAS